MGHPNFRRWGLVLAGGEGTRLSSFTKRIAGHELPKQFCPILSSKPLLYETLVRVSRSISPSRTLVSVNRAHRRFYLPILRDAPQRPIEEPCNRGTAPAILHALMRLYREDPSAVVGVFPSDHYISDEVRFAENLDLAFAVAGARDTAVLLGAPATGPEQAYGWIVPDISIDSGAQHLSSVRHFVEKPDAQTVYELWQRGALWNTFVLVARVSALRQMFISAIPSLYEHFKAVRLSTGTSAEEDVLTSLYGKLPALEFSQAILQRCAQDLLVILMRGVDWCDLGEPARVVRVLTNRVASDVDIRELQDAESKLKQLFGVRTNAIGDIWRASSNRSAS